MMVKHESGEEMTEEVTDHDPDLSDWGEGCRSFECDRFHSLTLIQERAWVKEFDEKAKKLASEREKRTKGLLTELTKLRQDIDVT